MKQLIAGIAIWHMCVLPCVAELKSLQGAYGLGKHAIYDEAQPNQEQIVSRLEKDGRVFECVRKDLTTLVVKETTNVANGGNEVIYFNYTKNVGIDLWDRLDLRLVDVWIEPDDMAFIFASSVGYAYVRLDKKPVQAPAGSFILEPKGMNSPDWMVTQILRSSKIGYAFPDWAHHSKIKSIFLASLSTFECELHDETTEVFSVAIGSLKKNNVMVQNIAHPYHPCIFSEAKITNDFFPASDPDKEIVASVEFFDGGKPAVFAVLDQFADQAAATNLRNKINQAYINNNQ